MDYIDVSAIDLKIVVLWGAILWLGWYTNQQTHRWFFALVLTGGLLFASARWSGVINDRHMAQMSRDAGGSLDGASQRARLIGNQRNSTSAGGAGETNRHYKKRIKDESFTRD